MNNYRVAIPSRGRWESIEKGTGVWRYIFSSSQKVSVYVREEECPQYTKVIDNHKNRDQFKLVVIPNEYNIADKRSRITEDAKEDGIEKLFIIDDDVSFSYRDNSIASKYRSQIDMFRSKHGFSFLIAYLLKMTSEHYPMTGLPLRQGSNNKEYCLEKNSQIIRLACYHVPTLKKEGIRADGLGQPYMSDRFVQLELLSRGYTTLSLNCFAVDDGGTGKAGGCSIDRTPKLQSRSAKAMVEHFKENIELVVKTNGDWKGVKRYDCKIAWKKFLQSGADKYEDPSSIGMQLPIKLEDWTL